MTGSQRENTYLSMLNTRRRRSQVALEGQGSSSAFAKALPASITFFTILHSHWYYRGPCESASFATRVGVSWGGTEECHKMPLSTAGYLCGGQAALMSLSPAPPRWHTCLCAQLAESPGFLAHLQGLGYPTQTPHL